SALWELLSCSAQETNHMEWARHWLNLLYEYGRDYVLENTGLKVLALLITAVLWWSVASRPVSEITLHNVPIELANLPKAPSLIPSKYDTLSASVTLRGPRDTLDDLRSSELSVIADMTGVEPGVRVIPLKLDPNRLPPSVEEVEIDPHDIRVTVEREVTREVPVKPRFDGEPTAGYEAASWEVTPSNVEIAGAASQVQKIDEVSTETVSLAGRKSPFTETVAIDIGSPSVYISGDGNRKVLLKVNITEVQKERIFAEVPVTIEGGPPNARIEPRFVTIKVYGPHSAVDALTPDTISVTAAYHKDLRGAQEVAPSVTLPDSATGVRIVSITPAKVRIR
ncbi:MAG TPA: CdaR family protein, partial [Blastocatellia bacterium]